MRSLLAVLLVLVVAHADADGLYISGSYGQTTMTKTPCDTVNFSCEPRVVGWKAAVGYRLNQHFSLEGQWVDLGRANRYAKQNESDFELGRKGTHSYATARGPAVMGMLYLPISSHFSAYAGAGIHALKVRNTVLGRPAGQTVFQPYTEGTSLGPVWAIGAQYDLSKRWSARAEFDHFHRVGGSTIGGITEKDLAVVSIVYRP